MIHLSEPLKSLDPFEWSVYADNLEDRGAPARLVGRARRTAKALEARPRLVLLGHVVNALADNPFRVGFQLFVIQPLTVAKNYRLTWREPAWVQRGFDRWGQHSTDAKKYEEVVRFALGTPADFRKVLRNRPAVVRAFFRRLARLA